MQRFLKSIEKFHLTLIYSTDMFDFNLSLHIPKPFVGFEKQHLEDLVADSLFKALTGSPPLMGKS